MTDIPVAKTKSLKSMGLNENWLQEKIFEDPSILGLGDLIAVKREKRQKSGGRLDILLKNPTDNSMFEVEVMLGSTDETHIIRTIEYWDFERRQYPLRQHYAVLVAESVTRRFFNVIQLLSASIPIIAIQVNMFQTASGPNLAFTKVLDVYTEPEDEGEEGGQVVDERLWQQKANWVLEAAKAFRDVSADLLEGNQLVYVQSYVAIRMDGKNLFWFSKRSSPNCYVGFRHDPENSEEVQEFLETNEIHYGMNPRNVYVTLSESKIRDKAAAIRQLVELSRDVKSD